MWLNNALWERQYVTHNLCPLFEFCSGSVQQKLCAATTFVTRKRNIKGDISLLFSKNLPAKPTLHHSALYHIVTTKSLVLSFEKRVLRIDLAIIN